MLKGNLSELTWTPRTEEQIEKDLFQGKNPETMIDAYEEQLGIKAREVPKRNLLYKSVSLSPCNNDADAGLLAQFYNSPEQYVLLNRSDYWTHNGQLKIFLEYQEDMDVKRKKDEAQAQEEDKES